MVLFLIVPLLCKGFDTQYSAFSMWNFSSSLYRIFFLTVILTFVAKTGSTQFLSHQQYWVDVNPTLKINNKLTIAPELGYRTEPTLNIKQVYFRGFAVFSPHARVKLSFGAAEFISWRDNTFNQTELRLEQYIVLVWPKLGGFKIVHRLGTNQRWFSMPEAAPTFVARSRYRIGLYSPKFSMLNSSNRFYSAASFEFLRNFGSQQNGQLFDHDWITLIFGAVVTDKVRLEAHLLLINRNLPETYDFLREASAFRLRVFYNIL